MKLTNAAGITTRLRKNANSQSSRIGASHSAIRKPITTDGTVAMISMIGLMNSASRRREVAHVHRPEQCQRHGEEHGVERAFQRAENQRHEAELRLEVLAAGRLPHVLRLVVTFVQNFAKERLETDFRAAAFDLPGGQRSRGVQPQQRIAPRSKSYP